MIDLENQLVQIPDHEPEPIKEWRVYFVTLEGMCPTIEEAHASCDRTGQPKYTIVPIPVAIGEKTFEPSLTAGTAIVPQSSGV